MSTFKQQAVREESPADDDEFYTTENPMVGMLTFKQQAAQGDLLIERVAKLPASAKLADKEGTNYVVAHSETGHHHTVAADKAEFYTTEHPMVCYLQVSESVDLIHHRSFDTHPTFTIPPGTFKLRRQREHTPSGWRRIED